MSGCLTKAETDECIVTFDNSGSSASPKPALRHRSKSMFFISELLEALHGMDLTGINDGDTKSPKRSFRKSGTVIGINVHYTNMETFSPGYFKYRMRPMRYDSTYNREVIEHLFRDDKKCNPNPDRPERCNITTFMTYPSDRYVLKRSGMLLVFTATGEIGRE